MTFDDKKMLALQFVRLGISPTEAMLHTEFTEEEIAIAEEDEEFKTDIQFEVRMEEIDLLKKLNKAMDIAVERGTSSAVQWKLERVNQRWAKNTGEIDNDNDNEKVSFYIPQNGREKS